MSVRWKAATAAVLGGLAIGGVIAATSAQAEGTAEGTRPAAAESEPAPDKCLSPTETEFLDLINEYRAEQDVPPLEPSEALNVASHRHSDDMGVNDYFDHDSQDGRSPQDRMEEAGYDTDTSTGENIAAGYSTAEEVFEAWRESEGHNENMLDPDYQVIGIGLVENEDSEYGEYWTTDFGGEVDAAPECG